MAVYVRDAEQASDERDVGLCRCRCGFGFIALFVEKRGVDGFKGVLDRLARSVPHLLEILSVRDDKGASLHILGTGIDTATPTGKLVLTVLGGIAVFVREMMLERQREGIAVGIGPTIIAKELGIGRASVCRIVGDRAEQAK
ncbi:recombinase family protein [Roseovarius arcticus]|uniref:recombinase family protein n=1 Tax=Roseovarius arcticus TaxID=2547404 RepID=UPI001FE8252D|nr:recombinase family protein [Roseovarius arcticus]